MTGRQLAAAFAGMISGAGHGPQAEGGRRSPEEYMDKRITPGASTAGRNAELGLSTRAIHHGYDPAEEHGALTPPIDLDLRLRNR
jgi:hypothetical protein